jgi:hypothetical protein
MAKKKDTEDRRARVEIRSLPLSSLKPADYNPRTISDEAMRALETSIDRFGIVQPIVWNKRTGNVVSGHQRLSALQKLGAVETDVVVVDLDDIDEKALNITQNNPHITGEFDQNMLQPLLVELEALDFDLAPLRLDELVGEGDNSGQKSCEEPYTRKVVSPVYEITGKNPNVGELFDRVKADGLISAVNGSTLPEEIKTFLRAAAERHVVFNYANIAEFYAHADKGLQALMEDSALVIIDFNKAIEQGFVRLNEDMFAALEESEAMGDA